MEDDDILSELINEIDDTGAASTSSSINRPSIKPQLASSFNVLADKQAAKNYMKSFSRPKLQVATSKNKENTPINIKEESQVTHESIHIENQPNEDIEMDIKKDNFLDNTKLYNDNHTIDKQEELMSTEISDVFDDDFDMTQVEDIEMETSLPNQNESNSKVITEEQLLNGWETMQENVSNVEGRQVQVDVTQPPLVDTGSGEKVSIMHFNK